MISWVLISLLNLDGSWKHGESAVVYGQELRACVVNVASQPSVKAYGRDYEFYYQYNCETADGTWVSFRREGIQEL